MNPEERAKYRNAVKNSVAEREHNASFEEGYQRALFDALEAVRRSELSRTLADDELTEIGRERRAAVYEAAEAIKALQKKGGGDEG